MTPDSIPYLPASARASLGADREGRLWASRLDGKRVILIITWRSF